VTADGRRLLLSHGDTIDRSNWRHLLLRSFLRSNFFYRLQRIIPLPILWKVARATSDLSMNLSRESAEDLAKKMHSFSLAKFEEGFDAVILGHCHMPMTAEHVVNGSKRTFVTLGDWMVHYTYLYYEDGRLILSHYRPRCLLPGERMMAVSGITEAPS